VQCITNPLDSPGELKYCAGPSRAREIIAAAGSAGAGVLGIRPVQGGALTDALDRDLPREHGVVKDFNRSSAFRALAREQSTSAAALAHRYALSMEGVDTVVLGCKNRAEIIECIAAAEAGPLEPALMARIDLAFAA
jgi:aryl-alcohol dehydrogenase-like predicted oxidoreductase